MTKSLQEEHILTVLTSLYSEELGISFWLLAFSFWLLAFSFWLLAFSYWLLAVSGQLSVF